MNAAWSKPLALGILMRMPTLLKSHARSRDAPLRIGQSHHQKTRKRRWVKQRGKVEREHTLPILLNDEEWLKSDSIGYLPMLPGSMSPNARSIGTARSALRIRPLRRRRTACTVRHSAARRFARNRLALEGEVSWLVCR